VSLKQDLERELKQPVMVKMGRPGALNVYVNGEQIYSYQRTKKYPVLQQLVGEIRGRQ
jgi:hypothetical protein